MPAPDLIGDPYLPSYNRARQMPSSAGLQPRPARHCVIMDKWREQVKVFVVGRYEHGPKGHHTRLFLSHPRRGLLKKSLVESLRAEMSAVRQIIVARQSLSRCGRANRDRHVSPAKRGRDSR